MTKFLNISTDTTLGGSSASDEVVSSQKALKTYIDAHSGGGGSVAIDEKSITKNSSDEIQTVGVIDQNATTTAVKTWTGTKAQYDAISTKDANTIYNITDDTTALAYEAYTKAETNALLSEKVNLASGVSQADVDYVIESQLPTSSNNYTWYRLYKSGWVEQGGYVAAGTGTVANFPITMADNNYFASFMFDNSTLTVTYTGFQATDRTTTSMKVYGFYNNGNTRSYIGEPMRWKIEGMAKE